jgi:glycosyltransferase involved in cell wall biosynthesis
VSEGRRERLTRSSFAIVANGFADGPAQALRDYLVSRGARTVTVFHPLTPEQGRRHLVTEYAEGAALRTRSPGTPFRAPLSFALDPLVPLSLPRVDVWFGFNPLACIRGLAARRFGRAERVVLWSVDFVPDRFGRGTLLTRLYDRLDRRCCRSADARVELTGMALAARNARHALRAGDARAHVVPMGAWLGRVPTVPEDGYERRTAVYLGHLVPRQGVTVLLDAIALLRDHNEDVSLQVIGGGADEEELRGKARALGLGTRVRFHGFVPELKAVERLLADASVGVAPYVPGQDTFTRWADPGKLKAYLAAGLPIVVTDVPPNAGELSLEAGAEVVPYDAASLAAAISRALASPETWRARRGAALAYVRRFDWELLLSDLLARLDLRLP